MLDYKLYICFLLSTFCVLASCRKDRVYCGDRDDSREIRIDRNRDVVSCRTFAQYGQWSDCRKYRDVEDYCPCTCDAFADNKEPTHDRDDRGDRGGDRGSTRRSGSGCFSGDTLVTLRNGKPRSLEQLVSSSDKFAEVLSTDVDGKATYSQIALWGHALADYETEFVMITTEHGLNLTLTPNHLIPVLDSKDDMSKMLTPDPAASIFAEKASVGNFLFKKSRTSLGFELDKIVTIKKVIRRGIYLPITRTGTIVINDILASCYSEVEDHYFAHMFVGVFSMMYDWVPEFLLRWLGIYGVISERGLTGQIESPPSIELPTVLEVGCNFFINCVINLF